MAKHISKNIVLKNETGETPKIEILEEIEEETEIAYLLEELPKQQAIMEFLKNAG